MEFHFAFSSMISTIFLRVEYVSARTFSPAITDPALFIASLTVASTQLIYSFKTAL